ncbi:MAG: hypothetical protein CMJ75_08865 [Planctomycetaceae bacterium]|nr:hypothetical protein [Planctomycetaceae bacterium]
MLVPPSGCGIMSEIEPRESQRCDTESLRDAGSAGVAKSGSRRLLYLALAALFFALGLLGVFLPLLPTTPLMLLTSYFLVRSYPPLNERLLRSRWIGPVLQDWQQRRGVRRTVKTKSIILVVLVVAMSVYFADAWWLRMTIVAVASVGVLVICKLPVVTD